MPPSFLEMSFGKIAMTQPLKLEHLFPYYNCSIIANNYAIAVFISQDAGKRL
jgi:hypothetical protein